MLPWRGFHPWPRNFPMPQVWPKKLLPRGNCLCRPLEGLLAQEEKRAVQGGQLTSSLSSTSTSPLASSSISLWMLRTASKLSFSSSLWHRGLSIRQNSAREKQETTLPGADTLWAEVCRLSQAHSHVLSREDTWAEIQRPQYCWLVQGLECRWWCLLCPGL